MFEFLTHLFDTSGFPPRWQCGSWSDAHGWLHICSDLGIWSAYFAIPCLLVYFVLRRRDVPFPTIFWLFGAFILACGTTHLLEAIIFWHPVYRFAGVIKLLTALVSWGTVVALVPVIPKALALRSPEELEKEIAARQQAEQALQQANADLERRVQQRTAELAQANAALEKERDRFRTTLSSIGDAVITTDLQGRVTFLNGVAKDLIGWPKDEAVGQPLDTVFHIIDEQTRQTADSPTTRALTEGTVVGLANHTLLISREGTEHPIDDSAAPIRNEQGQVSGVVLVFRDVTTRRQAERELRQSEERLSADLEAMARLHALSTRLLSCSDLRTALDDVLENAILTSEADFGNIQLYNPQTRALEIIAQRGFGPDFLDYFRRVPVDHGSACAQAMKSGQRLIIEDVEMDPSFAPHLPVAAAANYRAVQSTPLKNGNGNVIGMLSTHFRQPHRPSERDQRLLDLYARNAADFLERLRFDEQNRKNQEIFQLVHAIGKIGHWEWDSLTDENRWSPEIEALYGLPPGTFGGTYDAWAKLVHPDDLPKAEEDVRRALETGKYLAEFRVIWPDGSVHWLEARANVFRDGHDKPVRVMGVNMDITERKQAEEAVVESGRREKERADELDAILRTTPTPIWIAHDPQCHRVTGNPASLALLGLPEGTNVSATSPHIDPAKRGFREYRGDHPIPGDELPVQQAAKGVPVNGAEVKFVFDDGRVRYIYGNAAPLFNPDGSVRGSIAAFADVTPLKEAEAALREADRRKNEFLATLAHELRNPLAPIRNAIELLKRAGGNADLIQQAGNMMERQVKQVVRLVDDLLEVSRITSGKLQLRKERLLLAAVVQSAVESSRPFIEAQAHELTVTLPPQPIYLDADPTRLAQVFSNLLNNAAKYTEKGGHIWLTAECQGGQAVVSVRDTGIGIPAEHLPHLFRMFSQVAPTLERSQGGLGVGLALVKGLVELHGGTVEAHSSPGKGSEFVVRLPVVEPSERLPLPSAEVSQSPGSQNTFRILVADDNRDAADSLAAILRMMGHEVQGAYDGVEAVQAAATFHPDLAILDIGMPKMNGYEVARSIREQPGGKRMVLVALTGWGQEEDKRRATEAGFHYHLTKPVEPAALERLLEGLTQPRR